MRDCAAVREGLSAYLDGETSVATQTDIESHLEHCPPCYATVQRATLARNVLRQARRIHVSRDFDGRLRDRIRRELESRPWWRVPMLPRMDVVTSRPVIGSAVGLAMLAAVVAYSGREDRAAQDTTFRAPGVTTEQRSTAANTPSMLSAERGDSLSQPPRSSAPVGTGMSSRARYIGQAEQ